MGCNSSDDGEYGVGDGVNKIQWVIFLRIYSKRPIQAKSCFSLKSNSLNNSEWVCLWLVVVDGDKQDKRPIAGLKHQLNYILLTWFFSKKSTLAL